MRLNRAFPFVALLSVTILSAACAEADGSFESTHNPVAGGPAAAVVQRVQYTNNSTATFELTVTALRVPVRFAGTNVRERVRGRITEYVVTLAPGQSISADLPQRTSTDDIALEAVPGRLRFAVTQYTAELPARSFGVFTDF